MLCNHPLRQNIRLSHSPSSLSTRFWQVRIKGRLGVRNMTHMLANKVVMATQQNTKVEQPTATKY